MVQKRRSREEACSDCTRTTRTCPLDIFPTREYPTIASTWGYSFAFPRAKLNYLL